METIDDFKSNPRQMRKIIIGSLVIFAGVLLLATNLGFIDDYIRHIIFSWPMLLIVIGVVNLITKEGWIGGVILISIGSYFLLPRIIPYDFHLGQIFWPSLLILIGIGVMFKGFNHFSYDKKKIEYNLDAGYIDEVNIFGGKKYTLAPIEFKGGKITNIFGGSQIDLTQAYLAPGKNILELEIVFGGVNLYVPPSWVVHVNPSSIFGGISDKRRFIPGPSDSDSPELFIKGSIIFGGAEIKS